jgi:hypothetical protein
MEELGTYLCINSTYGLGRQWGLQLILIKIGIVELKPARFHCVLLFVDDLLIVLTTK